MNIDSLVGAAISKGGDECPLCEKKISPSERVVYVQIEIKPGFIKALWKTIKKEAHVACAKTAGAAIAKAISEAERL